MPKKKVGPAVPAPTRFKPRYFLLGVALVALAALGLAKLSGPLTWKAVTHPRLAWVVRRQSLKADAIITAIEQNRNLAMGAAYWAARSAPTWRQETVAALAEVSPEAAQQFSDRFPADSAVPANLFKIDRNAEAFVNGTDTQLWAQKTALDALLN
jgi:hypothetical protein